MTLYIKALYFVIGACFGSAAVCAAFGFVLRSRRKHETKLCGMLRLASRNKGDVLTLARVLADCLEWDEYFSLNDIIRWKLEDAAHRVLKKFRVYIP